MIRRTMNKNAGFTLIEVLIAVLLLAGGLLGLAALQSTSLGHNQSAYNRSQATQLAYDMADRIRANPVESSNRADADPSTLANSAYVATAAPSAKANCSNSSTGCSAADMAENDRFQWLANVVATLPRGTGSIAVVAATRTFTITINWDDNKDGAVNTNDPNFAMSFQL
jgi:type IV pilus assembly protein PilV